MAAESEKKHKSVEKLLRKRVTFYELAVDLIGTSLLAKEEG